MLFILVHQKKKHSEIKGETLERCRAKIRSMGRMRKRRVNLYDDGEKQDRRMSE